MVTIKFLINAAFICAAVLTIVFSFYAAFRFKRVRSYTRDRIKSLRNKLNNDGPFKENNADTVLRNNANAIPDVDNSVVNDGVITPWVPEPVNEIPSIYKYQYGLSDLKIGSRKYKYVIKQLNLIKGYQEQLRSVRNQHVVHETNYDKHKYNWLTKKIAYRSRQKRRRLVKNDALDIEQLKELKKLAELRIRHVTVTNPFMRLWNHLFN